ncbi:MAG: glycosyltransferase [Paludibacteraceae bacterium]|nr:glycosyltransferase [Paludibacteraceae bacterium]
MKLSIITIAYNNLAGLKKTLPSVLAQDYTDFEHVIIDGGSQDGSADFIAHYARQAGERGIRVQWVSERDKGIYNAMNKGIRMSTGEYIEILNSGDMLASDAIVGKMLKALAQHNEPAILYGNMLKDKATGLVRDRCFNGQPITLRGMYRGTLNHSPAYIRRSLFEQYGYYDEQYKIVSDWKWYLQVIIFGGIQPVYVDLDVTVFEMTGISETNKTLDKEERKRVLQETVPAAILADYDRWAFVMDEVERLKRWHLWGLVWFVERVLFQIDKRKNKKGERVEQKKIRTDKDE